MVLKTSKYGQTFRRHFDWKYPAKEFAKKLVKLNRAKPKRERARLSVKIEPLVRFISSAKFSESRTVGWVVVYSYLPPKKRR